MAAKKSSSLSRKDWQGVRESLASEYPDATDGTLFCIYKLMENPETTIPEFRDEAKRVGISIGGRALHSARVSLGHAAPSARKKKGRRKKAAAKSVSQTQRSGGEQRRGTATTGLEGMIDAIRENQREADDLRDTLRQIRDMIDRVI